MAKKRKFFKRLLIVPVASFSLLNPILIHAENPSKPLKVFQNQKLEEGYTINFENVSMLELLKFISKISNTNFIYDPQDLQFTITFTSDEPTNLDNIMTAFAQILRIHGLSLVEESNNIMIHKNPNVKQIANIVTSSKEPQNIQNNYLVTRVFNIRNANPKNIEAILSPLMSQQAVIMTSIETRQLIIMDLLTSVNKAAELISYLDVPSSNLEMRPYKFKNLNAESSSMILNQLIMPLSEGNPVILVPQQETNSLYIVSTPYLIQKSIEILLQIDQLSFIEDKNLSLDNVFIYKLKYKSFVNVQKGLQEILQSAQSQGYVASGLEKSVNKARYINTTNSIVFVGDKNILTKLKSLVESIDDAFEAKSAENNKFFIYEPSYKSADQLFSYLKDVEKHLVSSHLGDPGLITCLENLKVIANSNTLVFTGSKQSIDEITTLLKSVDSPAIAASDDFLIYTPLYLTPQTLLDALRQISKKLSSGGLADSLLIKSIDESKFIPSSYAIVFTGTKETILKVKKLMDDLDTVGKKTQLEEDMLIYKLKFLSKKSLDQALESYAETLPIDSPIQDTIEQRSYLSQSNSFVFKGNQQTIDRLKQILEITDTVTNSKDQLFMYQIKNPDDAIVLENLRSYTNELPHSDYLYETLTSYKYNPTSHLIIFKGSSDALKAVENLMANIDLISNDAVANTLNYKVQYPNFKDFLENLKKVQDRMSKNDPLYRILKNSQVIETSNLIIFKGSENSLKDLKDLLSKLDTSEGMNAQNIPIQKIVNLKRSSGKNMMKNLGILEQKLKKDPIFSNSSLLETLRNVELVSKTNSLIISGPKKDVDQISVYVSELESAEQDSKNSETIFNYKIKSPNSDVIIEKLKTYTDSLSSQDDLYDTLKNSKYVESSRLIIFKGTQGDIDAIIALMTNIDSTSPADEANFFSYKAQFVSPKELKKQLLQIINNFKDDSEIYDAYLAKISQNAQVVDSTNSLIFTGSPDTLTKIKGLISTVDTLNQKDADLTDASNFYIYKPKQITPLYLKKNLDTIAQDLEKSGLSDAYFIKAIKTARLNDQNNSIVFTGNTETLKKVELLIQTLDVTNPEGLANSNFFLYKATNSPAHQIQENLFTIATDLEKTGLSDSNLIHTIRSSRVISLSNSIAFTGDPKTLTKVQELATSVDLHSSDDGIEHIGQTTFLIYKIKSANPTQLMESLKALSHDLIKSKGGDQELIKTIDNMRYVSDTNSIVFTGSAISLSKINTILEKFDTPSAATVPAPQRLDGGEYSLYQPRHLNGDELIKLVQDFEASLKSAGIKDPRLMDSISNLKWMPKTGNIIVTGDLPTVQKVTSLLEKFDLPSKILEKKPETTIETFDETSFLIYKVQYHNGSSILEAVQGIGADLKSNSSPSTQALVNSINSLQFIKVTNSLIATGDPKALMRLKELIQSVDVPLKQVFIEVLVIETDLTSILQFGLRWAGQGNYKDRLGFSTGSVPPSDNTSNTSNIQFTPLVQAVNATTPPNAQNFPIPTGGSLGVIGDLIFHKGKTYISLGDFINAIQTDNDSTIVLNQKIITQDNRDTTLFVGQNIPYNGSVVTNSGQNVTTASNIEYMDVGIKLDITPKVGEDDIITMDISQDISEQVNPAPGGGSNANTIYGIQTRRTSIATSVHVPNEHFVVLTGQIRNSSVRNKSAIPCLGGLPLIGAAFSDNITNKQSSTIVMFIKPHIVNTYEEYKKITERQENLYRDQGIDEDFDAGLELVKTPEDQ